MNSDFLQADVNVSDAVCLVGVFGWVFLERSEPRGAQKPMGNYTSILQSKCCIRPEICVSMCVLVCVHRPVCVCLQRPISCLKTNHSKDSKAIEMQMRHTNMWLAFHPQTPKKGYGTH